MDNYTDFIRGLKAFPEKKYELVSSREKLVAYTIYYLEQNSIPILFNFVCVATFKLFPKRFHLGDFEEYPHIEMLNRTILHLRPQEGNYAEGRVSTGYNLTELGYQVAEEVENILKGKVKPKPKAKITKIDSFKKTATTVINDIENISVYKKWLKDKIILDNNVWVYFNVTPFAKIGYIENYIKDNILIARQAKNKKVADFLLQLEEKLNSLLK